MLLGSVVVVPDRHDPGSPTRSVHSIWQVRGCAREARVADLVRAPPPKTEHYRTTSAAVAVAVAVAYHRHLGESLF